MKYVITRTSDYEGRNQPCEGAIQEEVTYWIIRTCPKEELCKYNKMDDNEFKEYENFENNNSIWCRRKTKVKAWVVEVGDLFEFTRKIGNKVIVSPYFGRKVDECELPVLEIYDDYRE